MSRHPMAIAEEEISNPDGLSNGGRTVKSFQL